MSAVVESRWKPIADTPHSMTSKFETLEDAYRYGRQLACLNGCLMLAVFDGDGALCAVWSSDDSRWHELPDNL